LHRLFLFDVVVVSGFPRARLEVTETRISSFHFSNWRQEKKKKKKKRVRLSRLF